MVVHVQNMFEIINKYENSSLNKTDVEVNVAKIKLFEKKKIPYKFVVNEVHNFDKKIVKRSKKMISNNKYILFNSWYTKNRKTEWFSSHDMWNHMKSHASCKPFIDIFDYMEKLGKSVKVSTNNVVNGNERSTVSSSSTTSEISGDEVDQTTVSSGVSSSRKKKHDINVEEIKESNDQRLKMYDEFYRVLTVTFKSGSSPVASFLYDSKFTRSSIESGMKIFKSVVTKLQQQTGNSDVTEDTDASLNVIAPTANKNGGINHESNNANASKKEKSSRKRKHHANSTSTTAARSKQRRVESVDSVMVDDQFEDSQMSE
ncbi:39K [Hemileuca sp. nucleopolyhedrovirus]|uniref:39K n=1 Tax=Hemileuca sp. nucleopolyhedrovirus TaxID=1367203 RepID=S5MQ96_9ABAC|nr:39K [Hemileuca sp. nucleopolyhedrovirus]AGR56779.1 39K [Hemileuca sp. nucleopolyhedrovirus]